MIRLIASDMDGTLLNSDHDIDVETVKAIKKAEEAGIIFAISTGREYDSVKVLLDKHNIKAQCVLSNGAEYRDEDGNILDVINIKNETAKKIIEILDKNKMSARIFTEKGVFTTSTREMALQEVIFRTMSFNPSLTEEEAREVAENLGFFTCLQFIEDLDKFFEEGVEVRKFVAFHNDIELIDKMKKVLGEIEGLAISSSFRDNIEITDINAQKGIILEQVAAKMDIAREDVMILGDSFNDYSMFEIFEETVAMKNAIPEVKAIAKYITDSNDNLGVAKAIYNVLNNEMDKMLKSE
ncbi:Cof-type HAD-IIB family hydrolase [Clostridium tertium]|uniref:Cof-type HAD-IIB family hydrolase n=2 Tax=Clostridium TaxID=1485 RepID=UPI0024B3A341|nr:Cof-type HAD-IIB family hydrolase [Clostridium tertium]MDI9218323.1 Cof-type HAD-IIB family hydrolase [Clostridium tertium]